MKTVAMKLAGRCANGWERDRGSIFHALPLETANSGWGIALCGRKPGARSAGWSTSMDKNQGVTCPHCLRKLEREHQSTLIKRIQGALGTAEEGDNLVAVARDAAAAEMELAALISKQEKS